MNAWTPWIARIEPLFERVDRLSLRERGLLFGAGVAVIYMGWQAMLMDPLAARARTAEQRFTDIRQRSAEMNATGMADAADPAVAAATRNRALRERRAALDAELAAAAQGYVAPERMADLLRELLATQQGLRLVSLRNLPVESLSQPAANGPDASAAPAAKSLASSPDPGPFLHPVEMVVEGDYPSVVAYLHALERLPWRLHWDRLELVAGAYPANRVRIVLGALSLSRDWMTV